MLFSRIVFFIFLLAEVEIVKLIRLHLYEHLEVLLAFAGSGMFFTQFFTEVLTVDDELLKDHHETTDKSVKRNAGW